ncbi:MAG: hypothetical protein ACFFG0_34270 [Candidatus Thorarchaeota archaeon]
MTIICFSLAILFMAALKVAISELRLGVRTVYNIGMSLLIVGLLLLLSAIILELIYTYF